MEGLPDGRGVNCGWQVRGLPRQLRVQSSGRLSKSRDRRIGRLSKTLLCVKTGRPCRGALTCMIAVSAVLAAADSGVSSTGLRCLLTLKCSSTRKSRVYVRFLCVCM